ncbi:hypothetical protein BHM03_00046401 [Ensete ventricosum]|nr:hypothetical protein BHM03_00046401 [Ensete ventricosum]
MVLQKYRLIDTAGIRKRAAVASAGSTTEALSVNRALRAICRSDVVALVIEAMACITEQVFLFNSTLFLQNRIIAAVGMVEKERSRRLGTSVLNQVVQEALAFKPPPRTRGGKRGRVYYSTQTTEEEEEEKSNLRRVGGIYLKKREATAKMRRRPSRSIGNARCEYAAASSANASIAATNRFRLRIGGTYSVSGAAENPNANSSCNIPTPPPSPSPSLPPSSYVFQTDLSSNSIYIQEE